MTNELINLRGRSALVTGSTSGIGLAIAHKLAACGCNVGINGFGDPQEIQRLLSNIQERLEVEVVYCAADLRNPDSIYEGIEFVADKFGDIDILVNNAGIQHVAPVENFPDEKWEEVLAVNLSAVFHTSKAVIPGMIENGWGRIVNIASVHGLVGSENKSAYVAAKHGVVGFTKVVALENARNGLTCNAVCPGYIDTELIREQIRNTADKQGISIESVAAEMLSDKHPSGRFVGAAEVASLVAYLCSDVAAGITGSAISIDGGWSAQ